MSDFDNDNGAGMVYRNYILYIIRLNVRSLIINKNKKYRGDGAITEEKVRRSLIFISTTKDLYYIISVTRSVVYYINTE